MTTTSYWDPAAPQIDWEARSPLVLFNPAWVKRHPDVAAGLERRLPALDGHIWVATSGSTSDDPAAVRCVALSRDAFLASARAVNAHLSATSADVWAHALPIFHVGGLGVLARAWLTGSHVDAAVRGRWDAGWFHGRVTAARATLGALVPAQVHDLVARGLACPPSMRAIVVGGARLDPALYKAARALGWPCLASYGLTETCSQIATASIGSLAGSDPSPVIPLLSHAEVRAGATGRLGVRATSLLTCCALPEGDGLRVWDPKVDGWFETDDLGRVHPGGVEVLGRASDCVKVLGELVALPRVESLARRWAEDEGLIPGVARDLAVVPLPHERLGHELVLALAPAGAATPGEETCDGLLASLAGHARERWLPFERPGRVIWVPAIPRTPLGKCRRALLARQVRLQLRPQG